jgi:hypothetical protein
MGVADNPEWIAKEEGSAKSGFGWTFLRKPATSQIRKDVTGDARMSTRIAVAEQMIGHYNAQNADAYVSLMSVGACEANYRGEVLRQGVEGVRSGLKSLFARFPNNRATILARYEVGEFVFLHESVERAPGGEKFEVMSIYSFEGDKVSRVEFVR